MSGLSINLHGPLLATSREQVGGGYTCGIVKVTSPDGDVDLTIFTPDAVSAKVIEYAIQAAWPVPAAKPSAAA